MTPNQALAHGEQWYAHGWLGAATEYWQQVVAAESAPTLQAAAWDNLGKVAARRGQWKEALDAFQQALTILPGGDDEGRLRIAMHQALVWTQTGQTDIAYRQLWTLTHQATHVSPRLQTLIGLNLAAVQIDYDFYAQAITTLQTVGKQWTLEDQTRYGYFWNTNLGVCYVALRQWDEADHYLEEALVRASTDDRVVPVLVERALMAFHRGDVARSIADAQRALRIMWDHWLTLEPAELARLSVVFARTADTLGEPALARRFEDVAQTLYGQLGRWQAWRRVRASESSPRVALPSVEPASLAAELRRAVQWMETLFSLDIVWPQASYVAEVRNHVAQALAEHEHWPADQRAGLATACRLADFGLTAIDPLARDNPHRSPAAWQQYRQHPWLSCQLLAPIGLDETVLDTIAHHHEQPDGHGFPAGRTGAEIPAASAIYAVADIYAQNTLTAGHTLTWEQIQALAGSKLDSRWVGVMADIFSTLSQ
ncbi:MAG: phosphohydrolase [Sulfobacillus thermosulfidooxidans]|uniref:Phosphohydrolase n=1 Tax=Sulfobacillus thermosulfidooxidans TaxID=28034 RepID=A0A2T2WTK2_SULTH|nr:MAG: phosphohydrolase [Sulfobacillus thermosulfidooxidans]